MYTVSIPIIDDKSMYVNHTLTHGTGYAIIVNRSVLWNTPNVVGVVKWLGRGLSVVQLAQASSIFTSALPAPM